MSYSSKITSETNKPYSYCMTLVVLILITTNNLIAQNNQPGTSIIKGIVFSRNIPVIDATVLLQIPGDTSFITGTITDSTGKFLFADIKAGQYCLTIQSLGFRGAQTSPFQVDSARRELTIPPISLDTTSVKLLKEIIVKKSRPLIERKAGKIIFNVENSTIAIGSNAWDLLKKAPGVRTNGQGTVTIKVNTNAGIMVNNKLVQVAGSDLIDLLSAISSDEISKIEVISNPSAVYDAEGSGGLINIVTKKKKDGFNGTANTGYEQNTYAKYTNGLNFDYKVNRLTASLNHQYKNGKYLTREYLNQEYNNEGLVTSYNETLTRLKKQTSNTSKLDLNYDLDKKSTVGMMMEGIWGNRSNKDQSVTPISGNKSKIDSSYLSDIMNNGHKNYLSLNAHYKGSFDSTGRSLNIDLDYLQYYTSMRAVNINNIFDESKNLIRPAYIFRSDVPQAIRIYTSKLDYVHPVNSTVSLSIGGKVAKSTTNNKYTFENFINNGYINDTGKSNRFNYQETVAAVYGEITKTINNFTVQAGLRSEYTATKGNSLSLKNIITRSYVKVFPTIFLQQKFSDNYQLELAYGYRINRPSYEDMNPFRYYATPYSSSSGNPFLKPSYTHSISLVNILQNKYVVSVYYLGNRDEFLQMPEQDNKTKTIVFKQQNLKNSTIYGITFEMPFELGKWWQSYNSLDVSSQLVSSPFLNGQIDNRKNMATVTSNQSFTFSQNWSAEINATYQSPGIGGLYYMSSYSSVAIGLKRKLLHNKAVISVNISDIFRGTNITATVHYLDQYSIAKTDNDLRGIRLNFSYRFGNTIIKKSTARETGNKEEQNRLSK